MMRAVPYNLHEKGVVEVAHIKWKEEFEKQEQEQEEELEVGKVISNRAASSLDSEPTSTLDTTRRSPSSPTSTSTLSSSFTGGKNSGGVTELHHHGPDYVAGGGGGSGGSGGAVGLEEWDSMFPNGDGALLPWIMGEADDLGLGLKHLLQSGSIVDYEGNTGLGVIDQGSGLEGLSPNPALPSSVAGGDGNDNGNVNVNGGANLGFNGCVFGNSGKIGSVLSNCLSGVTSNGLDTANGGMFGSIPGSLQVGGFGGFGFTPHPQQIDVADEKPPVFNPQLLMNPQQVQSVANPSLLMPQLGYFQLEQHMYQPQAKRHNPGVVPDPNLGQVGKNGFAEQQGHELFLRKHQQQSQQQLGFQQLPMGLAHQLVPQHLQQKALVLSKQNQQQQHCPLAVHQLQEQGVKDQLFKAADLIQTGNFSLAEEILARLNHHLSLPAKPLIRVALYVKEALQMILLMSNPVAAPPPKTLTPCDIVHKMNAYKVFSEVSPITQFMNFTSTQAILEALEHDDTIHIIDFDIASGAQWASFIQELPLRKKGAPSLKITAITSLSTSHPFELGLVRENLVQFATDIGIAFEFEIVNLDLFDPSSLSMPNVRTTQDEAIAVCIPVWASSNRPSFLPSILRFIKQPSPKIIVSLDKGIDRYDVPFPQHLIHTMDSCSNFLESLDGLNVASDIVSKVERFFVQPRIENTLLGRIHDPDKMPHWKSLFASSGFLPLQFSNFTETQADYVVKRAPGRGFHVEKRQASLVLSWMRREIVAASAWRC